MVEVLEQWLQSPLGASLCCRSSGSVPIIDAISMCAELCELSGGSIARLAGAVGACPPDGPVAVDAAGQAVRLRSVSERVRAAAEGHVLGAPGGGVSLLDLLEADSLASVFRGVPEATERLEAQENSSGPAAHALGDAELREPGADGSASTPESAFRTPSPGSEPETSGSPCAPGGAQSCGASPTGRGGAEAAAGGPPQLEHAPCWSGADGQQLAPMCGGVGGQWLWCPLVLPVEGSPHAAAAALLTGAAGAQDMPFAGASGEAGAAGPTPGGDDVFPPGFPAQLSPRHDGSDAEALEASSHSNSCGPDDEPRAAALPHGAGDGAPAAHFRQGLGASSEPPSLLGPASFASVPGEGQWVWFPAAGADAFDPAWGWEGDQWPEASPGKLKARSKPWFPSRHAWVVNAALKTLENPPSQLADKMGPDGSVSIGALFAADPRLAEWCWQNPAQLVSAIKKTPECHQFMTADKDRATVRALPLAERVRVLCEDYMLERQRHVAGPAPVSELLQHPPVQSHVARMGAGAAASSDSEYTNTSLLVVQALAESALLELLAEESGEHSVVLLPPSEPLRTVVRPLLEGDAKLVSLLRSEGELSLTYLAEHPAVRRMLDRLQVSDKHSILSSLRAAVESSWRAWSLTRPG
ncbi:unnamed protein product [Prorocentrum cordatum]|uniref:Uncharacterized protein n=1 Tax=Prorocentrum cordatum TaxID=2364126 RepID=A0ABN9WBI2_9DINO|nr:unnamed protein product [Polarella glacialis]